MAHYALVDQGKVVKVIVAEEDFIRNYVSDIPGSWIKTSYNTVGGVHYTQDVNEDGSRIPSEDQSKALRYNMACIGGNYDSVADAFYPQQNFPSWILNTTTYLWESPIPYPSDGQKYRWNEDAYQEDNTTGWELVTP